MTPAEKTAQWLDQRLPKQYTTRLFKHDTYDDAHMVLIVDQSGTDVRLPMFDDHVVCVLGVYEEPRTP